MLYFTVASTYCLTLPLQCMVRYLKPWSLFLYFGWSEQVKKVLFKIYVLYFTFILLHYYYLWFVICDENKMWTHHDKSADYYSDEVNLFTILLRCQLCHLLSLFLAAPLWYWWWMKFEFSVLFLCELRLSLLKYCGLV